MRSHPAPLILDSEFSPCPTKRRYHSVCTAFRQSVSALWGRLEICLHISNLPETACTRRLNSVHTTLPKRPYSVQWRSYCAAMLLQTAFSRRSYYFSFFVLVFIFWATRFRDHSNLLTLWKQFFILHVFNSCKMYELTQVLQHVYKCSNTLILNGVQRIAFTILCIIHYYWWTASIKQRLLFSRAGYAAWGLSLLLV